MPCNFRLIIIAETETERDHKKRTRPTKYAFPKLDSPLSMNPAKPILMKVQTKFNSLKADDNKFKSSKMTEEVHILAAKPYKKLFAKLDEIELGFDRYYDLMKFLLQGIPFKYRIEFSGNPPDTLPSVIKGKADVGLGVVQPSNSYVGFSLPFSFTYTIIMTTVPPDKPVPLFYGLDHIKPLAYPLIFGCILGFALFLKFNDQIEIRIAELRNEQSRTRGGGLIYYFFQILGTIFMNSFERIPKVIGGQLAIGSWMLLIYVFSSTYLGFLKSSYSVSLTYPINTLEDLLNYPKLPIMISTQDWGERHFLTCKETDMTCKTLRSRLLRDLRLPILDYSEKSLRQYFDVAVNGCAIFTDLYDLRKTMHILRLLGYKRTFFWGTKHYFNAPEGIAISPYARQDVKEYFNARILRFFETNQEFVSILRRNSNVTINSEYPTAEVDGFMQLGVTHFKPLAFILLLGIALALVILVLEIITGLIVQR